MCEMFLDAQEKKKKKEIYEVKAKSKNRNVPLEVVRIFFPLLLQLLHTQTIHEMLRRQCCLLVFISS